MKKIVVLQLYLKQEEKEMKKKKTKTVMICNSKEAVQLIN